jgi:type I restriction enzyme M protein
MPPQNISSFIWSVADLLRGNYQQADYGKVILPFTVLRRLDCALEPTKQAALDEHARRTAQGLDSGTFLPRITGYSFYNTAKLDFKKALNDPNNIRQHLKGTCWMNPHYELPLGQWVKKARESADSGATVVCLLPVRTNTI